MKLTVLFSPMRLAAVGTVVMTALLGGCATTPGQSEPQVTRQQVFPGIYSEKPGAILVLPPINNSTAADAGILYSASIAEPLTDHGYYVLPVPITNEILHEAGISDGTQLLKVPVQRFATMFGADAVLFVTIDTWNTSYNVVSGYVSVGLTFRLVSTHSGKSLWLLHRQLTVNTTANNNNSSGNPIADLVASMIVTAIQTAQQDYFPIAQQVNNGSIAVLPFGRFHPSYGTDATWTSQSANNQVETSQASDGKPAQPAAATTSAAKTN